MKKKKEISIIRSSAAEYLTFITATGESDVNAIYFGDGYYDVASASEGYFGKEPEEMSEYECTLLAGIPNAPSIYAPTKNPDLAAKRQLKVLKRMEACGYFSAEEVDVVSETVGLLVGMR